MNGKVVIPRDHRGSGLMTAMKALGLVAVAWGIVFPVLFWTFKQLMD